MAHLKLHYNEYVATLRRRTKKGRWIKIAYIGNTGVAFDFVKTLKKLGHKVKLIDETINDPNS